MSETIGDVEREVRSFLRTHCKPVPSQKESSRKEHLEVWITNTRSRALGVEFDHDSVVNLWVTRMNVPSALPPTIQAIDKEPKERGWTDDEGRGANSNLSSYDAFRTRQITRLGVSSVEDAMLVLNHLNREIGKGSA